MSLSVPGSLVSTGWLARDPDHLTLGVLGAPFKQPGARLFNIDAVADQHMCGQPGDTPVKTGPGNARGSK